MPQRLRVTHAPHCRRALLLSVLSPCPYRFSTSLCILHACERKKRFSQTENVASTRRSILKCPGCGGEEGEKKGAGVITPGNSIFSFLLFIFFICSSTRHELLASASSSPRSLFHAINTRHGKYSTLRHAIFIVLYISNARRVNVRGERGGAGGVRSRHETSSLPSFHFSVAQLSRSRRETCDEFALKVKLRWVTAADPAMQLCSRR